MTWHVHIEWIGKVGIVRLFAEPVGPIHAETGQPFKCWEWSCVVVRKGKTLTLKAARNMPADARQTLVVNAARLGFTTLCWERWKDGVIHQRSFSLAGFSS